VNLDCLAILPHFNNPSNLTQTGQAEPGNAADALAAGLRLDFRWPAFGDDLATRLMTATRSASVGLLKVVSW